MYKRLITIILIITLFTGTLPNGVLAETNPVLPDAEPAPVPMDTFMLSAAELISIENLGGYATSVYHKGMSFSPSMTAWQMYCWLDDFQGNELAQLVNQSQLLMAELDEHPELNAEDIHTLKKRVDDMSRDLLRYVSDLEDLVLTIDSACSNIRNSELANSEKTNSARRLQSCGKRLQPLMDEVASKVSGYQAEYRILSDMFTTLHSSHTETAAPSARDAARLLAGASPFANLRAAGFYIQVLNANEAGFSIYDEQGKLLPDAHVTVSHGEKKVEGNSNAHGVFVFDTGIFGVDEDNRILVDVKIEADGLRTWEGHNHEMHPGDHPRIDLQADDGHAYIQAADLQRLDVLHEQNILYITPLNDAVQPFDVYVHQKPGDEGEAVVRYIGLDGTAKEKRIPFAAGSDTVVKLDFKDTWCRDVHENTRIELLLTCADRNGDELAAGQDQIVTKKAAVDAPVTNIPSPNYIPGLSFNFSIPLNQPGMKTIDLSFTPPVDILGKLPLNVVLDLDGTVMVGLSIVGLKKYQDGKKSPTAWKYDNARDVWESVKGASKLLAGSVNPANTQEARTNARKQLFDMGHFGVGKLNWGLLGMLQAKIDKDAGTGVFTGYIQISGDLSNSVAVNGGYPVFVGFDFNMGLSAGVQLGGRFKVNMEKAEDIGKYGYISPASWYDMEFAKELATLYAGFRLSIGVYAGIGVKNVLAAYIRGYFGFTLGLYITPWAGSLDKVFIFKGSMNAGLQLVVEALFGVVSSKFNILKWSDTFPKDKALTADPDDAVIIDGARAETELMSDRFNLKEGMKFVHAGGKGDKSIYLAFYTEPNANGLQRLKGLRSMERGKTPTEIRLDALGRSAFNGSVPDDAYVYAYDVVEIAESGKDSTYDSDEGVVAVAVFFARRSEDVDDLNNPGKKCPGKTYGELHYYYNNGDSNISEKSGIRIEPFDSAAIDMQVEFFYEGRSIYGEDYVSIVSWRSYDNPNMIHAAAERVTTAPTLVILKTAFLTQQHTNMIQDHRYPIVNYHVSYAENTHPELGPGIKLNFVTLLDHHGLMKDMWIETMFCEAGSKYRFDSKYDREELKFGGDVFGFQHLTGQNYLMLKNRNENGQYALHYLESVPNFDMKQEHFNVYGLGVWVSPTNYYAVDLGSSLAVYDMQTLSPSSKEADTRYVLRATYVAKSMDGDEIIATKPFTLAVFDRNALDPAKGVTAFRMLRQPAGFLEGLAAENKTTDEDSKGTLLKDIRVQQTPVLKIDTCQPDPLVKVGDTVNVMITASNIGNIPVSSFMLRMTGVDENKDRKILADYLINCAEPEKSGLIQYDASGRRVLRVDGETAVSQYIDVNAALKNFWVMTNEDGNESAYWTKVLMPEDARDFRVPFTVTQDMAGHAYDVDLSVYSISTAAVRDENGRYDSTMAWAPYLLSVVDDAPKAMSGSMGKMETLTFMFPENPSDMAQSTGNDVATSPVTIVPREVNLDTDMSNLPAMADPDMFSAYSAVSYPSTAHIDMSFIDLELNANLYHVNDQPMLHLYVTNKTAVKVTNIMLEGDLDGKKLRPVNLNGDAAISVDEAISLDVPVRVLTGGEAGRKLVLRISTDENERYLMNNEVEFFFLSELTILRHPQPITVPMNSTATFDVTAYGGVEPYAYQWQVSSTGVHGEYANLLGEMTAQLMINPVTNTENGSFYRCVVTDAEGSCVTSDSALLLVMADPLVIVSQPKDFAALNGGSAQFTVQAAGGYEPYSYQWQVLLNGDWVAINGATSDTLHLDKVTGDDHQKQYRCVVTDKVGRTVTSMAASLTITVVPVTGDNTPVELLIMLVAASLLMLAMLRRKRRAV